MLGSIKHVLCGKCFKEYRKQTPILKDNRREMYLIRYAQRRELEINLKRIRLHKKTLHENHNKWNYNYKNPDSYLSKLYNRVDEIVKKILQTEETIVILEEKIKNR
jgi:hypothetical protein